MSTVSVLLLTVRLGPRRQGRRLRRTKSGGAIERGIPVIERGGVAWMEGKKCSSCHRVGMMVWSLGLARQRGFAVSERLAQWTDWAREESLRKAENGKIVGAGNLQGVAQLLLARQTLAREADHAPAFGQLLQLIRDGQQPDGSWKLGGQLPGQKRPLAETTDVSPLWLATVLATAAPQESVPSLTLAEKRIAASPAGKSNEWYVARLLYAQSRDDAATATRMVEQLTTQQRDDGGFGWLLGDESDALATGMTLSALLQADVPREDPRVERAVSFLVRTQREDGSWDVKGTKEKKKKAKVEETASYWGTTWAVLALLESLPE